MSPVLPVSRARRVTLVAANHQVRDVSCRIERELLLLVGGGCVPERVDTAREWRGIVGTSLRRWWWLALLLRGRKRRSNWLEPSLRWLLLLLRR